MITPIIREFYDYIDAYQSVYMSYHREVKLLEYEAKRILKSYDLPTPKGSVVSADDFMLGFPCILKSQVPVGGRGKAGGIQVVETDEEFNLAFDRISKLSIGGYTPSAVYAEELLEIERELYLSIVINREAAAIELVAHPEGGIEVESRDSHEFFRQELRGDNIDAIGQAVADLLNISDLAFSFTDLLETLYDCFVKEDATLIEINPLVITNSGELAVADCKMELDDAAAFRHQDWNFHDTPADANFVTLDEKGTVATIANGAGLAMATVDAVHSRGLNPANFLDIGGSATTESIARSFEQITQIETVETILINIFGGIVQCDMVAKAIIEAKSTFHALPRLVIRLSGARATEARDLLASHNITLHDSLESALEVL